MKPIKILGHLVHPLDEGPWGYLFKDPRPIAACNHLVNRIYMNEKGFQSSIAIQEAMVAHELGHLRLVKRRAFLDSLSEEILADSYAMSLGYGPQMKEILDIYISADKSDTCLSDLRIRRDNIERQL